MCLRFPNDEDRQNNWLDAIQRDNFNVTKYSRLCSAHFNATEFVESPDKLILKNNAVPSIFNFPTTPTKNFSRKVITGTQLFSNSEIDHSYSQPSIKTYAI